MKTQDEQSISEMCETFSVTPRTLRFYEDKGLISPKRVGNRRLYSPKEVARMTLILRGKRFGFSLDEIKDLLELYQGGKGRAEQLNRAAELARARLVEMKEQRLQMDSAIGELSEQIAIGEEIMNTLQSPKVA